MLCATHSNINSSFLHDSRNHRNIIILHFFMICTTTKAETLILNYYTVHVTTETSTLAFHNLLDHQNMNTSFHYDSRDHRNINTQFFLIRETTKISYITRFFMTRATTKSSMLRFLCDSRDHRNINTSFFSRFAQPPKHRNTLYFFMIRRAQKHQYFAFYMIRATTEISVLRSLRFPRPPNHKSGYLQDSIP